MRPVVDQNAVMRHMTVPLIRVSGKVPVTFVRSECKLKFLDFGKLLKYQIS
jgi:hypothetical protein